MCTHAHAHHLYLHLLSTKGTPRSLSSSFCQMILSLPDTSPPGFLPQSGDQLRTNNIKNSPVKSDTSREPNWTPCLVPSTEPRRPHQAFVSACCSHHLEHTWDCYPSLHCLCEGSSCFWCSYRPCQHSK